MEIGTAIKMHRKTKGVGQRYLATVCGVSVNTICQIKKNNTFPHKSTIDAICSALEITVSQLLFSAISDDDIPQGKREAFKVLKPLFQELFTEQ